MTAGRDREWMQRAVALAKRGEGRTRPNPPVGAVVVRNDKQVGAGFHARAGAAHAEARALRAAGEAARGASVYVTLEPCSTRGRTPACTGLLIAAGVARVVIGVRDPNPVHDGKGVRALRRAGIRVTEGICREETAALVAPFGKWVTRGLPYVTLKLGVTLDGRIADARGRSRWITSAAARKEVARLRQRVDGILVGGGTVRADDPALTAPARGNGGPYRIVVSAAGRLPASSRILRDADAGRTIVAVTDRCSPARRRRCGKGGAQVWRVAGASRQVSLKRLLRRLGKRGLLHVLCEGGGEVAHSLIRSDLVDEYLFFVAPRVLGGTKAVPAVGGRGWSLAGTPRLRFTACERVGDDVMLRAVPARDGRAECSRV